MATSKVAWGLTLLMVVSSLWKVDSLESNYYQNSCPAAEATIRTVVANAVRQDKRVGGAMLRMFFHDCFVQGCDASVLIDSLTNDAEKDAVPNQSLHSFEVIDQAKEAVERICRQTVSCADVVAFAASTSLAVLGGPIMDIQGGRLDGLVSSISDPPNNIPSPTFTLAQLQTNFTNKGLSTEDLVILSGAHTIGMAHCVSFNNRLRNFSSTCDVDPSLDARLAAWVKQECPVNFSNDTLVNNDCQTPTFFDNKYYQNVANGQSLFTSDAQLYTSSSTKYLVNKLARDNSHFLGKFADSLQRMGQIGVKTGGNGNIRTNCRSFR